jgi:co-chaperonin GroES (HSP10)
MNLNGNRLIVVPDKPTEQSSGGIFIPDNLQEPRNVGKVIAIGTTVDPELEGKQIMFELQAAHNFTGGGVSGKLIFVSDIVAVLN